jgi:selenocysteine lyase/cysteine desulfurase
MTELKKIDGVHLWTDPAPDRSAAIVIFKPGSLDPRKLGETLNEKERIVVTTRGATGANPGLRVSAHFYNTMEDMDRFVAAIKRGMEDGR